MDLRPDRRRRAGIDETVTFATKPRLALDLLADLHAAGKAPPWATGDEVYGRDSALRGFCQSHDIGYVFEVDCSFRVQLTRGRAIRAIRADRAVKLLQPDAWNHRSAGPGSKGERRYAWAWLATTSPRHHLLVRRSLSNPVELACFYTYVPDDRPITLPTLVRDPGITADVPIACRILYLKSPATDSRGADSIATKFLASADSSARSPSKSGRERVR